MSTDLILCLFAFGGSAVFAMVLQGWRERVAAAITVPPPPAPAMPPLVSLIVPVRNGADTLALLLQDLHAQQYPKERLEVIVVDDHSTDRTRALAEGMMRTWPQLQVVANEGEGKKAAITKGARIAKGTWLVITDADARCGAERVACLVAHGDRERADMLLAPVRTDSTGGLLGRMQEDEQAALMLVTAATALSGSPVLANGANMAFTRETFHALGGYHGDRFASGDDVFLLHRMIGANKRVAYVMDARATVHVEAERTWKGCWQQRLRWAGKMRGVGGASNWISALALFFPYVLLLITCTIDRNMEQGLMRSALLIAGAWALWFAAVVGVVREGKRSLGQPFSMVLAGSSYLLFCVYAPVIGILSFFVRSTWKGRRV